MAEWDPGESRAEVSTGSSVSLDDDGRGLGWVGFAVNAASGRGGGRAAVTKLVRELERLGVESRVAWTLDERRALVDDAASGDSGACRCLVAVGGDGTVAALINERPEVPIAVMPAGTENLFAGHFGFGRNPARAASRIVEGRSSPLDLGLSDGRRFALMAGFRLRCRRRLATPLGEARPVGPAPDNPSGGLCRAGPPVELQAIGSLP